jgi:hypothetical protein
LCPPCLAAGPSRVQVRRTCPCPCPFPWAPKRLVPWPREFLKKVPTKITTKQNPTLAHYISMCLHWIMIYRLEVWQTFLAQWFRNGTWIRKPNSKRTFLSRCSELFIPKIKHTHKYVYIIYISYNRKSSIPDGSPHVRMDNPSMLETTNLSNHD